MSASGRARAEEFSWARVTAKVEAYYGFVIRRLAAAGTLPPDFNAAVPPAPARSGGAGAAGGEGRDGRDALAALAELDMVDVADL